METTANNKNIVYYIHVAIYLVLTFGIGFMKPFGQITELGMDVLGVFIGVIYGWIFLGLTWPSLFSMIALALIGYDNINTLFASGFSYYVIPVLFISFFFAAAVGKTGINEWMAEWLMSRKIVIGRPYLLIAVLLFGMELLTMMNSGYVALFMIWAMAETLAQKAGLPKRNPFVVFMIPSLLVVFVISGFILPFLQGPVMYMSFFSQGMGAAFPQLGYMIWHLVIVNVYILILVAVAKFVFKIDMASIAIALEDQKDKQCPKMNSTQKFGFVVLLSFMVIMLSPMFLPATWKVISLISSLGILGVATIFTIILFVYRQPDGTPLVKVEEAARGVAWDVIWLLVATTPLAAAFQADACGIMPTIMGFLTPILMGMSPAVFIIATSLLIGIASQFIHNLVLVIVFVPVLVPMCAQMGGNPYACYLAIYFAATMAFMTPAASMNAAFIFGHDALEAKDGYFNGLMHFVLAMLTVYIIGLPLANILF